MAQLQKARIDALEKSRAELERLNRAKGKALDHLSHELRTPLAVIQGNLKILKRKLEDKTPLSKGADFSRPSKETSEWIMEIQQETEKMIRSVQETDMGALTLFTARPAGPRYGRGRRPLTGACSFPSKGQGMFQS